MKDSLRRLNFPKSIVFFIFLTILVLFVTHIYTILTMPIDQGLEGKVIEIKQGLTISEISSLLKREEIIQSIWLFKLLTRIKGGLTLKSGEYQLNSKINMIQLLDILQEGRNSYRKITVPEGYNTVQIAQLLEKQGLTEAKKFIDLVKNKELVQEFGIQAQTLEGYLFPDTYHFSKGLDEKLIITSMVRRFHSVLPHEWKDREKDIGLSLHEVITLASLIEKETSKKEEKALISAVYHNRLRKGLRLQCDPTVIYALENFNGNLTKEDLLINSPYNTYQIYGLPPGPIASPGEESILAAFYPAKVDYFYFVSRNDGTHHFSRTLEEHNQAVAKYQKRR